MKRVQLTMSIVAVFVDYAMLLVAAYVAYAVRYMGFVQEVRPIIFDLPAREYAVLAASVAVLWIVMFAFTGLYTTAYRQKVIQEISRVITGSLLGFLSVVTIMFWSRELFSSRFILLAALVFAIIFVAIGRLVLRLIRRQLLQHDKGVTRVCVIGDDVTTTTVASIFKQQPVWGFRVMGRMSQFDPQKIEHLLSEHQIDEIFLTDPSIDRTARLAVYEFCIQHHVGFRYVADMFDAQSHNVSMQTIGGVPIVEIRKTRLEGWGRVIKRLFDVVVAVLLTILFLPVLLVIALLIKLDSPGPVIYKNVRVGRNGKEFVLYKFRRMKKEYCTGAGYDTKGKAAAYEAELIAKQNNRDDGLYKVINDPRSTRMGRWLERTSLDELPQLFNVLGGSMSLVGPRPHQPREVAKFPKNHERVMVIKPGITGLAQISGRSDLSTTEELRLDVFYIENWSLQLDISILFRTPFALLKRHKS